MELSAVLQERIAAVAADRESGASAILLEVIDILERALADGTARRAAAMVCGAQPEMAPVWNAAAMALSAVDAPERFARFAQRATRSGAALARAALACFGPDDPQRPEALPVVTLSMSGAVLTAIAAVRASRPVTVSCAEGRPGLEGRRLARRLAEDDVAVTCYTDAAIAQALDSAAAVIVGADAITPSWFINKSGTRMLAAAAHYAGVPVYVAATFDKFVAAALAPHLIPRDGAAHEVWADAPPGVLVRNPYFERISLDFVSAIVSDRGVLGTGMIGDVCASVLDEPGRRALDELIAGAGRPGGSAGVG